MRQSGSWPILVQILDNFATTLDIWTFLLLFPSFRPRLIGKTICRANQIILAKNNFTSRSIMEFSDWFIEVWFWLLLLGYNCIWVCGNFSIFWEFLRRNKAKIGWCGLGIGLPINLDLKDGQNEKQVHMSKYSQKSPIFGPNMETAILAHRI